MKAPQLGAVVIAATCSSGLAGVAPWIAIPAGTAGLSAITLPRYVNLKDQADRVGHLPVLKATVAASAANALCAATASYAAGVGVGWLFNVSL